jgi:hypothetical protein
MTNARFLEGHVERVIQRDNRGLRPCTIGIGRHQAALSDRGQDRHSGNTLQCVSESRIRSDASTCVGHVDRGGNAVEYCRTADGLQSESYRGLVLSVAAILSPML